MFRHLFTSCLIAASLAGCTADVGTRAAKDEVDIQTDDALVAASEGRADSASRPTLVGELTNHESTEGRFGRSARYLAFSFDANEGDDIRLNARAESPSDLDTVLILYKATSGGRPSGASIAFNDDVSANNLNSRISYTAEETRKYVAIVRRYDRGSSGTISIKLDIAGHVRTCGGVELGHEGQGCLDGQFCDHPMDSDIGACGGTGGDSAPGVCRDIPQACPEIFAPVCGCDGTTYSNACLAAAEGVSVEKDGECRASRICPATGISCTPECPGSGRINGRPCRTGNFDAETCTCNPIEDCRARGCSADGARCSHCWGSYACLPPGARC